MDFEMFKMLLISVYLFSIGMLVGYLKWAPSSNVKDDIIDGLTLAFVVRFVKELKLRGR